MVSVDGSVPCICSVSGLMVQSEHSPSHDSISSLIPFDIQLVTVSLSVGEMSPFGKFSSGSSSTISLGLFSQHKFVSRLGLVSLLSS
ncbi:hypothetical protein GDO86_019794 [Hymenochirus boettgeri]|uniref:Uncharacterized protein n=1 Tax=Hymenochirus boettgeri TaxID=247094 RepID=A0A8T2IIB4_9PIPI|nr:hypothetical protein GDO86_019794 [Hymenochirus boettgeri]